MCVNGKFPPFDIWSNLSKGISQPFVKVKHRNMEIYGLFLIKRGMTDTACCYGFHGGGNEHRIEEWVLLVIITDSILERLEEFPLEIDQKTLFR